MESISTILFDMDGTLIDSMRLQPFLVYKYLAKRKITFKEVQRRMAVIYYLNKYTWFRPRTFPLFIRQFQLNFMSFLFQAPLLVGMYLMYISRGERIFSGVKENLERLKQENYTIGLVTNGTPPEIRLKVASILDCFDLIVCATDVKKKKPNPDMILKGMKKAGSNPKSTLYVGDTIVDMKAARNAGCRFALMTTGTFGPSVVKIGNEKPEFVFESIPQLADWILAST